MIIKATFQCDQCGRKHSSRFPRKDKKVQPRGWYAVVLMGTSLNYCSKSCKRKFERTHSLHHTLVKQLFSDFRKMIMEADGKDQREHGSHMRGRDSQLEAAAKEFDIPLALADDFCNHLMNIPCLKCEARAGEFCHAVSDDDVSECPVHGPEMKMMAHKERVEAAKKTWSKGKPS